MILKGDYHGIAHVLAVTNVIIYEPIGSDVKIREGNTNTLKNIRMLSIGLEVACN